jgi:hypothetical protein
MENDMALAEIFLPRITAEGLWVAIPDTLASLVAEVAGIVGDLGVSGEDITRALNRGLFAVCGRSRLPDLSAEVRLSFGPGQADAPLPANWQHGPTDAFLLPARGRVRVLPDLAALRRSVRAGVKGRVRFAAVGAGRLSVRPVPETAVDIGVGYFRLPDPLLAASDKPCCLPPHLAGSLLVNYACRELFERLEEGVGDGKVQATAYGRRFEVAMAELLTLYGPVQDEPVDVPAAPPCPWVFGEDWP